MDHTQRANAAQMAARSIKPIKPRGGRARPLTGGSSMQQSMPSLGGGLFGGSVQSEGGFNFSAPSSGLSFPPPSFVGGNSNPFGMSAASSPEISDNDERRDPAEERPHKRRMSNAGPGTSTPFQTSNAFGQSQQSNVFGSQNGTQQNGSAPFGGSQPSNPFKSAASDKSNTNIFSFGGATPAQMPTSPATSFGKSDDKNASNIFTFGSSRPAASTSSAPVNFGSTTVDTANTSSFTFGQTPSQPTTSGFNFGTVPGSKAPSSGTFGAPQPPSTSLSVSAPQLAPSNLFAGLNNPASPAPVSTMFQKPEQSPVPASNIFGSSSQPNKSTSNVFASSVQPASPTIFGAQNPQNTTFPSSNSQKSANDIFGSQKSQISDSHSLGEPKLASNAFGGQNPEPVASPSFEVQQAASNAFGGPKSPSINVFGKSDNQTTSSLSGQTSEPVKPTNNLLSTLNKPVDASVTEPKLNGQTVASETPKPSSSVFSTSNFSGSSGMSNSPFGANPSASYETFAKPNPSFEPTTSSAFTTEKEKNTFAANAFGASKTANEPPARTYSDPQQPSFPATNSTVSQTSNLPNFPSPAPTPETIRELMKGPPPAVESNSGANFAPLAIAKQISESYMDSLIPAHFTAELRKDFYACYRLRALNVAMSNYFAGLMVNGNPVDAITFYTEQREILLADVQLRKGIKRKATSLQTEEAEQPSKRSKQADNNAVQQRQQQRSRSPPKTLQNNAQPSVNGDVAPKDPASVPPQPSSLAVAAPSKLGKRRAEAQLTKDQWEQEDSERPMRQMKTPQTSRESTGSSTSNAFKSILDGGSQYTPMKSPTKKPARLPSPSKEYASKPNPFGGIPVPTSPTKTTPVSTAPASASLKATGADIPTTGGFAPKVAASGLQPPTFSGGANFLSQFGQQAAKDRETAEKEKMERDKCEDMDSDEDEAEWEAKWYENRRAEKKKREETAKSSGPGFVFKQPMESGASSSASKSLFGATTVPSNSNGLFTTSKAPQNTSSGLFSPFDASRTSTPGPLSSAPGSVFDGHASGKKPSTFGSNIFGHLSDSGVDSGKSDDADDESEDETDDVDADAENRDPTYKPEQSGSSSPSTPVDDTGAGIASAKKAPLSFASSASVFGAGSPISGSQFGGNASSGTTTPRGGLFDRIKKDGHGNPIRQVPSEEKENTQPSAANIFGASNPFGSLNKPQGNPINQTWSPDSPIKFASATPGNDTKSTAPTVNVTAATPTKTGSPSNIFGHLNSNSPGPTSAPSSNLFGNLNNSKPLAASGVGFTFGGSSNTSSLFPSATTSRATSPGGTTDGDSAIEGDAESEKHQQIDLMTSRPGEEDEDVIHEVRVRAQIWAESKECEGKTWVKRGVGPLRVLKHKESGAVRMLMRAEPSGKVVLNKSLLAQVDYIATEKTVKFTAALDVGEGFENWIIQMKEAEWARALASVLEANKPSS